VVGTVAVKPILIEIKPPSRAQSRSHQHKGKNLKKKTSSSKTLGREFSDPLPPENNSKGRDSGILGISQFKALASQEQ